MSYAAISKKNHRVTRARSHHGRPRAGRMAWLTAGRLETLVLIVIALLLIIGVLSTADAGNTAPELSSLKVQPGDTVWTLASEHPVEGLTTAQVADLISRANGHDNALITPGESLLVPSAPASEQLAAR